MRVNLIWFCLLWQTYVCADVAAPDRDTKQIYHEESGLASHQAPLVSPQPGYELVNEARAELRKLPVSRRKYLASSSIFTKALRLVLSTIPLSPVTAPASSSRTSAAKGPPAHAVSLLDQAAQQNNSDALYLLAELNFYGNYSHPRNLTAAFGHYHRLSSVHGNATAQYMTGLFYSTGVGNVVPRNQAKALLYYTFAAEKGDSRAEMAVGFRHHGGIGTSRNCEDAVKYYKRVADKAIEWIRSGPPGGMAWIPHGWRISDDDGGIYGEGASASSAGIHAWKAAGHQDPNAGINDVIEYLDLMSQKGDSKATFSLGRIYYEGQRALPRDFDLARKYFYRVASRFWRKDGYLVDENHKPDIEKIAARAAGFLGRIYLRGDGVVQDFSKARTWFERGKSRGDAQSQYGLGLMLLRGYGGETNVKRAAELLRVSADQDFAPARVQMGRLYLDQGSAEDVRIANNYFEWASQYGSIEALYYLAEMLYHGVGREKLCAQALMYYKLVAERTEPLVASWADANEAYETGESELALLEYLMAAEQGYESAQTNVAYMLDSAKSKFSLTNLLGNIKSQDSLLNDPSLALLYWTRSSRQSNIDSLVKAGDYYFHGLGTERDISKAVACYTGASDYSQSAQALFNLGWMHENGVGLKQDFHLAKRYYDNALQVNVEAYLPVTLSLLKLRIRSAWNTLTGGSVHSIENEPKVKKDWSLSEWITNFMKDDGNYYTEDDFVEDYYDTNVNEDGDFEDDGVLESIMIVGITMALVFLIWWRNRIQQARGAAGQNQQQPAQGNAAGEHAPLQNAGANPPQNDPGDQGLDPRELFGGWAANGVGL